MSSVAHNRNLRRIQLAFVGSSIGDWAYATAVAVWAYGVGGAKVVGIWMAIRYTLMAVSAPFTSALADKMSRKLLMILCDLSRALLVVAAAVCLFVDTPARPCSCWPPSPPCSVRRSWSPNGLPASPGGATRGADRRQRHREHHRVTGVLRRPRPGRHDARLHRRRGRLPAQRGHLRVVDGARARCLGQPSPSRGRSRRGSRGGGRGRGRVGNGTGTRPRLLSPRPQPGSAPSPRTPVSWSSPRPPVSRR